MKRHAWCFVVISLVCASAAHAQTTYHVRADGGDSAQCNGLADAAYPGSGTNQPCAWAHPFYGVDDSGQWRIQGGDTIIIHAGSYRMGYGTASLPSSICSSDYPWGCHLPPLPSGPDPQHPTRLLGEGWDGGCPGPPELWGAERAEVILDLTGTSNALVGCLEITDHSGCAPYHCVASVACPRDHYPYGDYADTGIQASDSARVTLQDLNIHGMASDGLHAARLTDWTLSNVRLSGNGMAGWDGDVGDDSSDSGTMTLRHVAVEWNGCPESYPGQQPANCWGQNTCGGYGDGVGLARTGGHWIIEDSVFRYNVSDGLDMLYAGVDHPDAVVEVTRCAAYGNAGNQIKIGGTSRLINCLAVGNCGFFYQKPFGQQLGQLDSGDHCRAGGATLSINLPKGRNSYVVNSTVVSQGWAEAELQCNTLDFPDQPPCDGSERVTIQNSIFHGYQVLLRSDPRLCDFIGDGDPNHFTTADGVDHNVVFNCEVSSPVGTNTLTDDPLLVNALIDELDGHLQAGSPAIGYGLPIGSLNGLVPNDDIEGNARANPPSAGAYEYNGTPACTLSCTAVVPASAQVNAAVSFAATATPSSVCAGSVSYDWDFGDGSAHAGDQNPAHTYAATGAYVWKITAQVQGVVCARTGSIVVSPPITPPVISSVAKKGNPFRLLLAGSGFQAGLQAFLGDDSAPWPNVTVSDGNSVTIGKGKPLKKRFPKGQSVSITVVNPDGGEAETSYTRP